MIMIARSLIVLFLIGIATGVALTGQSCSRLNGGTFVIENPGKQNSRACFPPPGVSGTPRSVEQVVALINSLPRPVSLACFLEALDRPLRMFASQSSASVQPASGPENPRYFIFSLPLIMTVTTDGPGATRMELSVLKPGNLLSTKAEIEFPVTTGLTADQPYARVFTGAGTSCSSCHQNESADPAVSSAAAFMSSALRPLGVSEVDLNFLENQYHLCNPLNSPDRCLVLRMLFGVGPVLRTDFPAGMQSQ